MSRLPSWSRGFTAEDILAATTPGAGGPDNEVLRITGDPVAAQQLRDEQRHRQQYIDLSLREAELERRGPHMNPRAAAAASAGLEYDLSQFQDGLRQAFTDRRNMRQAGRELDAAMIAFRNNEIDERQLGAVAGQIEKTYGQSVLIAQPVWRELKGIESEFQAQKQALVAARAAETGTPEVLWRFDDDSGQVTPDADAVSIARLQMAERAEMAKPELAIQKNREERAERSRAARMRVADRQFEAMMRQQVQPDIALNEYNKVVAEIDRRFDEEMEGIVNPAGELAAEPAAAPVEAPAPTQSTSTPPLTHPKLPGVRLSGNYATPAQAKASMPKDSYALVSGVLVRRDANGRFVEVP